MTNVKDLLLHLIKEPSLQLFLFFLSEHFLPPQLICGGKKTQSLPKYEFSKSFFLSANPTHYSNSKEPIKLIENFGTVLHKEMTGLGSYNQKALIIFDVFTGQMTTEIKEVIETHNLTVVNSQQT